MVVFTPLIPPFNLTITGFRVLDTIHHDPPTPLPWPFWLTVDFKSPSPLKMCHNVISPHLPDRPSLTHVPEKTIGLFHTLLSVDSADKPLKWGLFQVLCPLECRLSPQQCTEQCQLHYSYDNVSFYNTFMFDYIVRSKKRQKGLKSKWQGATHVRRPKVG